MFDLFNSRYHVLQGKKLHIKKSLILASSKLMLSGDLCVRVVIMVHGYCITYFCRNTVLWSEILRISSPVPAKFSHFFKEDNVALERVQLEGAAHLLISCAKYDSRYFGHKLCEPADRVEYQDVLIVRCSSHSVQSKTSVSIGVVDSKHLWTRALCQQGVKKMFQIAVTNDIDFSRL